jgi:carnitine-CoA ligase
VAAVVPTDPTRFDPASLFTACRHALAANAMPSYLQVVSALPKTLSEKPQRRFLLEHFDPAGPDVFTPSS